MNYIVRESIAIFNHFWTWVFIGNTGFCVPWVRGAHPSQGRWCKPPPTKKCCCSYLLKNSTREGMIWSSLSWNPQTRLKRQETDRPFWTYGIEFCSMVPLNHNFFFFFSRNHLNTLVSNPYNPKFFVTSSTLLTLSKIKSCDLNVTNLARSTIGTYPSIKSSVSTRTHQFQTSHFLFPTILLGVWKDRLVTSSVEMLFEIYQWVVSISIEIL